MELLEANCRITGETAGCEGDEAGANPAGGVPWDDDARESLLAEVRQEWNHLARGCDRLQPDLRSSTTSIVSSLFAVDRLIDEGISPWHWKLCHGAMFPMAEESSRAWHEIGAALGGIRRSSATREAIVTAEIVSDYVAQYHVWIAKMNPPVLFPKSFTRGLSKNLDLPDEPHYYRTLAESVLRDARRLSRSRGRTGYTTPEEPRVRQSRVRLQGGERDNFTAILDGRPVEPNLTPRMYRLLSRLVEDNESGGVGLTKDQLEPDRPAISELMRLAHWKGVIECPRKRGRSGRPLPYYPTCPTSLTPLTRKTPDGHFIFRDSSNRRVDDRDSSGRNNCAAQRSSPVPGEPIRCQMPPTRLRSSRPCCVLVIFGHF